MFTSKNGPVPRLSLSPPLILHTTLLCFAILTLSFLSCLPFHPLLLSFPSLLLTFLPASLPPFISSLHSSHPPYTSHPSSLSSSYSIFPSPPCDFQHRHAFEEVNRTSTPRQTGFFHHFIPTSSSTSTSRQLEHDYYHKQSKVAFPSIHTHTHIYIYIYLKMM